MAQPAAGPYLRHISLDGRCLEILAVILSAAKDDSQDTSLVRSQQVLSPNISLEDISQPPQVALEVAGDIVGTLLAYTLHRCVALLVPVAFVSVHPERVRAVSNAS